MMLDVDRGQGHDRDHDQLRDDHDAGAARESSTTIAGAAHLCGEAVVDADDPVVASSHSRRLGRGDARARRNGSGRSMIHKHELQPAHRCTSEHERPGQRRGSDLSGESGSHT